ncbi:MAG: glutamate--tRNA ligase [Bdellovibrionia bacterium]
MTQTVRTRYAPSPTGYMHIGNLRTALYAYLVAKQANGQFLLRIEDTDQARFVADAVDVIYKSLRVTGLLWDEGPDKGGPVGPYVQSERKGLYRKYGEELLNRGKAYRCFCTKEELDQMRQASEDEESAPIAAYDGRCGRLSAADIEAKLASGLPFVIRQRIEHTGSTTFHDVVYGDITINNEQLDDQVLIKSDGMPTYNFANVVDDHLMGITHVMRGTEYISSTPKYVQLYQSFGWEMPVSIHLPLILGSNGKKLSKREGAASLEDFLEKGYLPEAILNYIALLGWSPGDDTEFFTLNDLVQRFDIKRIGKSAAIFDEAKLKHLNTLHVRALTPEKFHELATPYYPAAVRERFDTQKISALIQSRVERMTDVPQLCAFLMEMPFPYDKAIFEHKKMKTTPEASLPVLEDVRGKFAALEPWTHQSLHDFLLGYATEKGLKNGQVLWPVRVAITGLPSTPGGAVEAADLLGKQETLARLDRSISLLK